MKMKYMRRYFRMQGILRHTVGWRQFLKYTLTKVNSKIELNICGHSIFVRKGYSDVWVALQNLRGEYDPLVHLFPKNFSGIIVDAGANIGTSSLALSDLFPHAKILAIEPSSETLELLKLNLKGKENVEILHAALVGSDIQVVTLSDRGTASGFTVAPDARGTLGTAENSVRAVKFSHLPIELSEVGLVKMDIEGAEKELFDLEAEPLSAVPVIMVELHDRIVPGCTESFFEFVKDRITVKAEGEKYISIANPLEVSRQAGVRK